MVGAKGFEPSTSWSRTRHLNAINALFGVAYGTGSAISPLSVVPNLYLKFEVTPCSERDSCAHLHHYFRVARHPEVDGQVPMRARSNSAFVIKPLFLLKMVAEVIDPVTGAFQLSCIKREIRSIEATNIRMMNLLLIIYPSIGRLQTRDIGRQAVKKIMGWN